MDWRARRRTPWLRAETGLTTATRKIQANVRVGSKRKCRPVSSMSVSPPKADIAEDGCHFRLVTEIAVSIRSTRRLSRAASAEQQDQERERFLIDGWFELRTLKIWHITPHASRARRRCGAGSDRVCRALGSRHR